MAKRKKINKKDLPRAKTIPFNFGEGHIEYIRKCRYNTFNILEGAVRSGKTVDNVFAFAHELKTTPDRIHLATGVTLGAAKLNIGDANGFGLEWIFRGQCHWGRYKGMDALIIQGPATNFKQKIVIFSGDSYARIRGNSYGMWIATEINLCHDETIKEAFNRTLASKNRKIFWDMNPSHPNSPIYTDYIDLYAKKDAEGTLKGGFNYAKFTIFDNVNITQERLEEIVSQYDPGSIWYVRDILGERVIAEGLVYSQFASLATQKPNPLKITVEEAVEMCKRHEIIQIVIGVDFGGNGSGHSFVATGATTGYGKLVGLWSELHKEELDPDQLGELFVAFVRKIKATFGFVTHVYADSAEQVLIRGLKKALANKAMGDVKVDNAIKKRINDRIFAFTSLVAQGRFVYTENCETLEKALLQAAWKPETIDLIRLDNGTSDIDTLDGFEYSYERDIKKYIKTYAEKGGN